MKRPRVVLDGIVMGESVRWHDGDVWFSDWGAGEVIRVVDGAPTVVSRQKGLPFCFDWLPGGELVLVNGPSAVLSRDGEPMAALGGAHPWNDIAVDPHGNVFVNNIGYDFPGGEPAPGFVTVVTPDGKARQVAGDLQFPNGMAVSGGDTLIVAESHASRLTAFDIAPDGSLSARRVWASMPGSAPDGICVDADGAVWYADVPHRRCVRVREGGEIVGTVEFEHGAFDCTLTPDGQTLYTVTADYTGAMFASRTGKLLATDLG